MGLRLLLFTQLLVVSVSLQAQVTYDFSFYPLGGANSARSADFNRDGRPDLVVTANPGVNVLFNVGAGKFGSPVFYNTGSGVLFPIDVNNDGWPDLVFGPDAAFAGDSIRVFLNNQNGTFRPGPVTFIGQSSGLAGAGDLNHDGKVDLVVTENSLATGPQLQIFLGTGAGTFSAGQVLRLSASSGTLDVEDYNGDGFLDIANIIPDKNKALVWWGNGNGTFRAPLQLFPPISSTLEFVASLATGDFNNDGRPDLAVSVSIACEPDQFFLCGTNREFIYRNNGNSTFTLVSSVTMGEVNSARLYASDLNGDQNIDLVVAQGDNHTGTLAYAPGNGNGTFAPPVSLGQLDNDQVLFRDLDLDSRHDIVFPETLSGDLHVGLARSGFTNCSGTRSGLLRAKVCLPAAGAILSSPVLVRASGNAPIGVKRLEVWIDGKKAHQRWNDQLAKRFTLTAGTHRIAVVAVDKYRGTATTAIQVTVK